MVEKAEQRKVENKCIFVCADGADKHRWAAEQSKWKEYGID